MEWFLFALLAPMFWAVGNIFDKYVFDRHVKNPLGYQIFASTLELSVFFILVAIVGIKFVPELMFFGLIMGALSFVSFALYNKSLMIEETSRIASMIYFNPIFVVLFASVFLGEFLSLEKYVGIALLTLSAFLITYRKVDGKHKFWSLALFMMIIFSILWASYQVVLKYALSTYSYLDLLVWIVLGSFIGALFLLLHKDAREDFLRQVKIPIVFTLRAGASALHYMALVCFMIAISLKDVSLVTAIPSLQPLFVLVYVLLLSKFMPHIYKELLDKKTIALKLSAVILIFLGSYFILF